MAALEMDFERFEGQGSTRHFAPGSQFTLGDHFAFEGESFTLLAVEHHAANNLGANAAELLGISAVERGSYRNRFHAVRAATPVVPRRLSKPTAAGLQTALVVGLDGEAPTTDRDLRVKLQFPWQRGTAPLPGGLSTQGGDVQSGNAQDGNAPGNETSGTWVRVAQAAAGANWGSAFVPRIGTEVAVAFVEGDIDRPIIAGCLYNGQDTPPFAAGEDSGVNHPGVIDGWSSRGLDGSGFNQWVLDNACGQLRMRLLCSYSLAEVGLGHLIQQGQGAQRGAWRGSGFELGTQAWASLRAGRGLLVSTSARTGSYGSAEGTQMDAAEALAQLQAARELGQRLGQAAQASQAAPLSSHDSGQALERLIAALDPAQDGRHPGPVNGQDALKADGRTPTDPVEAFAQPLVLLDTPSTAFIASDAAITASAGQDFSLCAHGDVQHSAAHTYASVSGEATSLFTHAGGIKVHAARGPVSLHAHTDQLQVLAEQGITVVSVNDEITVSASGKIELIAGQSSIVLDGQNIDFSCPGTWEVKASAHAFSGGGSQAAELPALPVGVAAEVPREIELHYHYDDLSAVPGAPYKVSFTDNTVLQGTLDANGYRLLSGVPAGAYTVEYGEDPRPWQAPPLPEDQAEFTRPDVQSQGREAIERMLADDPVTSAEPLEGAPT